MLAQMIRGDENCRCTRRWEYKDIIDRQVDIVETYLINILMVR